MPQGSGQYVYLFTKFSYQLEIWRKLLFKTQGEFLFFGYPSLGLGHTPVPMCVGSVPRAGVPLHFLPKIPRGHVSLSKGRGSLGHGWRRRTGTCPVDRACRTAHRPLGDIYPGRDKEYPQRGIRPWYRGWWMTRHWPSTARNLVGRENTYVPKNQFNLYLTRMRRMESNTVLLLPKTGNTISRKLTSFTNDVDYLLKKF